MGSAGGGMGIGNLANSVGVCIDTCELRARARAYLVKHAVCGLLLLSRYRSADRPQCSSPPLRRRRFVYHPR